QENLNEIADALNAFLEDHWDDVFEDTVNWMDFELLLTHWASFRPDVLGGPIEGELTEADYKHEKVGVFWGLLFLTSQSKVELLQENFYQDLKVRQLNDITLAEVPSYALPD
ncbi:MAG: segregation/condensation protein A, partial [Phormidesmis sp.]